MQSGIDEVLVGREISAICFVRDYVEVHFDGPILRCLTDPSGRWGEWGWRFPEGDSMQAMRLYIGLEVTGVELREEEWIALDTTGGHRFIVPLDDESRVGAEAAHLVPCDERGKLDVGRMWIW